MTRKGKSKKEESKFLGKKSVLFVAIAIVVMFLLSSTSFAWTTDITAEKNENGIENGGSSSFDRDARSEGKEQKLIHTNLEPVEKHSLLKENSFIKTSENDNSHRNVSYRYFLEKCGTSEGANKKHEIIKIVKPDVDATTVSTNNLIVKKHKITEYGLNKLMETVGVYDESQDYNMIIDGHATGLRQPTNEEWLEFMDNIYIVDSIDTAVDGAPSAVDNSLDIWFPPIGNQDGEGSCVCFAVGYYEKTYQEAKEHNWDLSGASWEEGYSGHPTSSYQDKIMSPDFIYHQILYWHDNDDHGSCYGDAMNLVQSIGCCSWQKMPYDPTDSETWPNESAWREAPLYRGETGYNYQYVPDNASITALKSFLADDNLAVISINAGYYSALTSDDLWTVDNYTPTGTNHANTIVGYDDNFGPYTEEGKTRYGAFKVANSWGTGFSGDHNNDGFYWISYEAMKRRVEYYMFMDDKIGYKPELLSVFEISHNNRTDCDISVGMGSTDSPDVTKDFNNWACGEGKWPASFPSNKIVFDITEFNNSISTPIGKNFFLRVYDGGSSTTGTITNFSVEYYSNYTAETLIAQDNSIDPPVSTLNGGYVYAQTGPFATSFADDVGVKSINYPKNGEAYPLGDYAVNATIHNYGTNNQNNVPTNCSIYKIKYTPAMAFSDDIEYGTNGWTAWGNWSLTTYNSNSSSHSWYCGNETTREYNDNWNEWLVSPSINLSGYDISKTSLTFWTWYDTESCCDYMRYGASPDNMTFYYHDGTELIGTPSGWVKITFPFDPSFVNAATGHTNVAFWFRSDGSVHDYEGCYIDDVKIEAGTVSYEFNYSNEKTISSLNSGNDEYVNFNTPWSVSQFGDYLISVTTNLTGDEYAHNDQKNISISIMPFVVYVDDDFSPSTPGWSVTNFSTIQAGVDAVTPSGTVHVFNGTYNEHVTVDKAAIILGENTTGTMVNGTGNEAFDIQADNVEISNFTIGDCQCYQGIRVDNANNLVVKNINIPGNEDIDCHDSQITISNSTLDDVDCHDSQITVYNNTVDYMWCDYSQAEIHNNTIRVINMWASPSCTIENNSFNIYGGIQLEGYMKNHFIQDIKNNDINGKPIYYYLNQTDMTIDGWSNVGEIILANCSNVTVKNLAISESYLAIETAFSHNISITDNTLQHGSYGVYTHTGSSNISIDNNTIAVGLGVYIFSSTSRYPITDVMVTNNDIHDNWQGIYLGYSTTGNQISNNTIYENSRGLNVWDSSGNEITGNSIYDNYDFGIYLEEGNNNLIYHNNFINNTQQAYDAYTIYAADYYGSGFWDGTWTWTNLIGDGEWQWSTGYGARLFLDSAPYTSGTPGPENHWLNKTLSLSDTSGTVTVECSLDYDGTAHTYWFTATNGSYTKNFPIDFSVGPFQFETFTFDISEFAGQSGVTIGFHVNMTSDGNEWFEQRWLYVNTSNNIWHNGYPSGGNYWNDFDEPSEGAYDNYSGADQDVPGSDRIVDGGSLNPYYIPGVNNQDTYPLTHPWGAIPPLVNFSYIPSVNINAMETIHFTDLSTDLDGTPVNWTWDFDDGTISYDQNPNHQYVAPGVYNVVLTVRDDSYEYDSLNRLITVYSGSWNYWNDSPNMWSIPDGNVGIGTNNPQAKLDVRGSATFNDDGGDNDFRIEGTSEPNLFFVDANSNCIGIGTNTPSYGLDLHGKDIRIYNPTGYSRLIIDVMGVKGRLGSDLGGFFFACDTNGKEVKFLVTQGGILSHALRLLGNSNGAVFNEGGLDRDLRVETTGNTHMLFIDAANNYVGIGTNSPQRALHINGVMRLEPTLQPGSPSQGDIYSDSGDGHLYYYNGSSWIQIG